VEVEVEVEVLSGVFGAQGATDNNDGGGGGGGGGGGLEASSRIHARAASTRACCRCDASSSSPHTVVHLYESFTNLGCRVVDRAHPGPQSLVRVEVAARAKVDQTNLYGWSRWRLSALARSEQLDDL